MLIKREVMNKLVGLDEEYSPGYIEDNDLSLRILQLGYRLMLCHDVFIHHYLGTAFRKNKEEFNHLILKNRTYFEQKWNFSCFAFDETKNASIFLAESPQKVLDFDCGIGVSCLRIKYFFPQVDIVGVETDPNQRKIAKHFVPVICNYKELDPESFDTIFIGNALEKVDNPLSFLQEIKALLKPSGVIIGEICNMASIHHILELINDHWYYSNFEKKNHFTRSDLEEIFQNLGYQNGYIFSWVKELTKEEQDFLHSLEKSYISYNNTYYSFRFSK